MRRLSLVSLSSLQLDAPLQQHHPTGPRHHLLFRKSRLRERGGFVGRGRPPRLPRHGLRNRAAREELRPARIRGFPDETV